MRRPPLLLIALTVAAVAGSAHSQDDTKKKRPTQVLPPPAAATTVATAPDLRPPSTMGPVLRSAVRPSWASRQPFVRNTAGQCRATCGEARFACRANEVDAASCDPIWTQCLSSCAGLGYSRALTQP